MTRATSAAKLAAIEVERPENLKSLRKVDIGFGTTTAINQIPAGKLPKAQKLAFYSQCRDML